MGIFAKGSQFPADVTADTPQNRYGDQLTEDTAAGEALGEAIAVVNATAESANTTAGEIIADIEDLEGRVDVLEGVSSTRGTGWVAHKRGGVTSLLIQGKTVGFTLPLGFRPRSTVYAGVVTETGQPAGIIYVETTGVVSFFEQPPSLAYGHLTFIDA